MSNMNPVGSPMDGRFIFFQEFLKHPLQIGSIIPSSRFLEQRILEAAGIAQVKTVVELGSGTGGTTRAILRAMPQHAKLLSIEINPHFHTLISSIQDDRLIAHLGNARGLKEIISMYGLDAPEALVSGIPFSTMKLSEASQVIETISSLLASNGRFVAYQLSKRVESLCRPFLGSGRMSVELLNIPPMRVYKWSKNGA
jgi:phosphatidylethanolamine/phosphatidyl-N-methylethanolamine N-methyltransferase